MKRPPQSVPVSIATFVPALTRPLPATSSSSRRSCGRTLYLSGPLAQELRQDAVLERAEECRLRPHEEEQRDEPPELHVVEGGGGQRHQDYFDELDYAYQPRFFVFVGDLPSERREEEEGQNEEPRHDRYQHRRVEAVLRREVEGYERDERALEEVVVERAEELRQK